MKISAENAKTSKSTAAGKQTRPQVVRSKDAIGGMLIVGLGPGPRKAA